MNTWGREHYGDPCRGCGFRWSVTALQAKEEVVAVPGDAFESIRVSRATGREKYDAESWTVAGYLAHVADNLRIWAERIAGVAAGEDPEVSPYDQDLLAKVRDYERISLNAAMWTLRRAVVEWAESVDAAVLVDADEIAGEGLLGESDLPGAGGFRLVHPQMGELSLTDAIRLNAHDARHHLWDIQRSLS